ncbi:Predicted ATPase [Xylanibacter ruminicola]|uniref:Predicted ATPase n=1 Tax=Xylanibacter ruminicola TaxID=839 RepID=A0A1M7CTJ3_XYLRU|nr:AAA family ATPase [Xylanibacter ruminicola]SHL70487.1 Predicted ATPase [Xylanibacter ruminicola]
MDKIGFKNFRRYNELSPLSLGRLTLLSGGNNSGKSTLVKAAMLAINYLKTPTIDSNRLINMLHYRKFFFDINNVHVSSFIRGINNKCNPESDRILFSVELGGFSVSIEVKSSDNVTNSYGYVSSILIEDIERSIKYNFIFEGSSSMTIDFSKENEEENENDNNLEDISNEIAELEELTKSSKDFQIIADANDRLTTLRQRLRLIESMDGKDNKKYSFPLSLPSDNKNPYFVTNMMASFIGIANKTYNGDDNKNIDAYNNLSSREKDITLSVLSLVDAISSYKFEYIAAHAASQRSFYTIYDASDYTAQTVHGFFNSGVAKIDTDGCIKISANEKEEVSVPEKLMLKYMNLFDIGSGIRVKSINNESYTVDIIDDSLKMMPLADKGMGAIQLTILLLRIVLLLKKYEYTSHKPIILVEEPEQNLHPKTQSLLADFFYEISTAFKFQILVETHSEYLVRKMQVIFASQIKIENKSLEELNNLIKVYFFPENNTPYLMTFLNNGRFENTFDPGFFDEAGKWNRELNKLERL